MSVDKDDVEIQRSSICCCAMPSMEKARGFFSSVFSIFHAPSAQNSVSDKSINGKHAPFHTPQVDRKQVHSLKAPAAYFLPLKSLLGPFVLCSVLCLSKDPHPKKMYIVFLKAKLQTAAVTRRASMDFTNGERRRKDRVMHPNIEAWDPDVYEKELLRRTWSDDFDFLYNLGSAIYCYIFEHNPNCKQLFPFIKNYKGDEFKNSKEFRSQALKFVQTLAQTVKNVYHMDRVEVFLYGIGQRHCKFADRGFKAEYWDIFQDAMEHSLEGHLNTLSDLTDEQKKDAVRVWRTLALYVTTHMSHGFFDGLKGVNKFAQPAL